MAKWNMMVQDGSRHCLQRNIPNHAFVYFYHAKSVVAIS